MTDTENHALSVGDLPFITTNDLTIDSKVMREFYNKHEDILLKDVEIVGIWTGAPSNIMSRVPITKFEDLKGKRTIEKFNILIGE